MGRTRASLDKQMEYIMEWLEKLKEIVASCSNVLNKGGSMLNNSQAMEEFNEADGRFNRWYQSALLYGETDKLLSLKKEYDTLVSIVEEANAGELFRRTVKLASELPQSHRTYEGFILTREGYVQMPDCEPCD